ncbi:unnamed protein product [Phytophthora lilii]|uniref:Unnamed protein product n=1 Tax=Phytophthora lilii TaxID=2077276 RepID=A0A9W6WPG3_9STRA|nr:unnamed protein product [Phytophthora lilii]
MLSTKGSFQPEQEQDPLMSQTDVTKTKQEELFQKVSPNIRMLFFPFRFLGFWLGRKFWFEDPNAPKARTLLDDIIYGEGPRFRIQTGELYFTDMHDKKVIKYSLASGERTVVYSDPEDMLSGLGWLPDGRLLISSMNKRRVLVHDEQAKSTGVFGLNNADFKTVASAAIVSVGTDGAVRVEATGVVFPNGMVITPDGKTLIVGETFEGRLTAYDVGEDGKLSAGRLWADVGSPSTVFASMQRDACGQASSSQVCTNSEAVLCA